MHHKVIIIDNKTVITGSYNYSRNAEELNDENIVMPVSVMPHGEYGLEDVYLGIPAVLTGKGIKELVEYHLSEKEMEKLLESAKILQDANKKMMSAMDKN